MYRILNNNNSYLVYSNKRKKYRIGMHPYFMLYALWKQTSKHVGIIVFLCTYIAVI